MRYVQVCQMDIFICMLAFSPAEDDSFVVWKMFSEKEAPSLCEEESKEEDYYFSDA